MPLEKIRATRSNQCVVKNRILAKGEEIECDPAVADRLVREGVAEFVDKESPVPGRTRTDPQLNLSRGPIPPDVPDPDAAPEESGPAAARIKAKPGPAVAPVRVKAPPPKGPR